VSARSSAKTGRAAQLAEAHGLAVVDLSSVEIEPEAAAEIPVRLLERVGAVPYRLDGQRLRVAVADPSDVESIDELRLVSRFPLEVVVAPVNQIRAELRRLLARSPNVRVSPLPTDVDSIIERAIESRASDVHFVPTPDALTVRIRVDGVVRELERIPKSEAAGLISRLKVLANLDIAEQRKPQDGRLPWQSDGRRDLDIRVTTLPTVDGEGAVLRLLEKARSAPTLSDIGLSFEMQMDIERLNYSSLGALLVCGPTGSGKSTTIYAALDDIHRPGINVVTVEDPVEYRLPEIFQVEVNRRAGLTFAAALRGVLRADPDVIMIGEIRDSETASIALEAALTGHFVLSTLHTNDPPTAMARLIDIGVEPYLAGAAVTAVLSQRLVRRVCTDCRVPVELTEKQLTTLGFSELQIASGITMFKSRGCEACSDGYRGRVGVFQLMLVNDEIAELTATQPGRESLKRAAFAAGMRTLRDDGLDKVGRGLTTIDELERSLR
jgi:type IV pilus assembly protein PilB